MLEFISENGRYRAVVVAREAQVEVVLWRSAGAYYERSGKPGRNWRRLERSLFDQPIEVVCRQVETWLGTLA